MIRNQFNYSQKYRKKKIRCFSLQLAKQSEQSLINVRINQKKTNLASANMLRRMLKFRQEQIPIGFDNVADRASYRDPQSYGWVREGHKRCPNKAILSLKRQDEREQLKLAVPPNNKLNYDNQPLKLGSLYVKMIDKIDSDIQSSQKQQGYDLNGLEGEDVLIHVPSTIIKSLGYLQVELDLRYDDRPQLEVILIDNVNYKRYVSVITEQSLASMEGCTIQTLTKFYTILAQTVISQRSTFSNIFEVADQHLHIYFKRGPSPIYLKSKVQIIQIPDPILIKSQRRQQKVLENIEQFGRTCLLKLQTTFATFQKKIQAQVQLWLSKIQSWLEKVQKQLTANLSAQARHLLQEYRTQIDDSLTTYKQNVEGFQDHLNYSLQQIYPVLKAQEQQQGQLIKEYMRLSHELELSEARILGRVKQIQSDNRLKMRGVDLEFESIDAQLVYIRSQVREIKGKIAQELLEQGNKDFQKTKSQRLIKETQLDDVDQIEEEFLEQRLQRLKEAALKCPQNF